MKDYHETPDGKPLGLDEYGAILDAYEAQGWRQVPLKREDKSPKGYEWQKRLITRKEIEENLKCGGGVGIQAGECSGWLCAVDLDQQLARELAPEFLPDTLTSGKEKEPLPSHYVYISEGAGFRKIADVEQQTIIDLKASSDGRGHQFVVAPSVHETKGRYVWTGGFDPTRITRISCEELDRRIGRLAAAVLIAQHFPPHGGRHYYRHHVAGFLLRNGESVEGAIELMRPSLTVAGVYRGEDDPENVVHDTAEKLEEGAPVTGGGKLQEAVPGLPRRIGQALGWSRTNTAEGRAEYARTDDGNALRFVDRYGDLIRYCPPWKSWLVWDGLRWSKEAEGDVMRMARSTARSIHADAAGAASTDEQKAINKWAIQSQHANRIQAMIALAKWDARVEVRPEVFDAEPYLLTAENGTLDLRTGELQPHDPFDLITRLAPVRYDPDAQAPRFQQFLIELFAGEAELITFMQRFAGYTLTGDTRERLFALLYGFGKNGKSTLIETLHAALGDYAQNTDVETLLIKRHSSVGNDVAALKGARFVSAAEVERGRQLAESRVKQLTGRDTVTARFLFGEFFDFKPEFKLWLSTNNKPIIRGTDDAIWDRIALVPFTQRFVGEKADTDLPEKLKEELPGILSWMVEGCLAWQQHGLEKPGTVEEATQQYREEMDTLAAFFEDRCVIHPNAEVGATRLYQYYQIWCDKAGEKWETQKAFGMRLGERGFVSKQGTRAPHKGLKIWYGIGLRVDDQDPDDGGDGDAGGKKRSSGEGNGLPEDEKVDDRLPQENPPFAGSSSGGGERVDDGRPFFHNLPPYTASRKGESGKRSTSSTSSTGGDSEPEDDSPKVEEDPRRGAWQAEFDGCRDHVRARELIRERHEREGTTPPESTIEKDEDGKVLLYAADELGLGTAILNLPKEEGRIGLDLETTNPATGEGALNPEDGLIRLITFSRGNWTCVIDCFYVDPTPLLEEWKKAVDAARLIVRLRRCALDTLSAGAQTPGDWLRDTKKHAGHSGLEFSEEEFEFVKEALKAAGEIEYKRGKWKLTK